MADPVVSSGLAPVKPSPIKPSPAQPASDDTEYGTRPAAAQSLAVSPGPGSGQTLPAVADRSAFLEPQAGGGKGGSDYDYMRDMQQAMVNERQGASALLLALIAALLIGALTWAHFSRVEEITRGEARVIPSSREQIIQSLEGGILQEMMVREGEVVAAGQPLLRID